jgi:hypothetical protein
MYSRCLGVHASVCSGDVILCIFVCCIINNYLIHPCMFASISVGVFVALVYVILLNMWPGLDVHVFVSVWCVRTSFRGVFMSLCATFCHHDLWADPISF